MRRVLLLYPPSLPHVSKLEKITSREVFMKNLIRLLITILFIISCEHSYTIIPGSSDGNGSRGESRSGNGLPSVAVNNFEKKIMSLTNQHRSSIGKTKLKWHDSATIESQDHSQDMASFRTPFGHTGFSSRISRIEAKDPDKIIKSGENVAQNSTAQKAFNAWLRSPGHRKNIEGDFTHLGVGAIKSANGSWYFTQIFLKK